MKIFVQKMISEELVFLNDFLNDLTSKIDIGKTVENILSISAYLGKNSAKFMIDMVMILIFFFFFTLLFNFNCNFYERIITNKKRRFYYFIL
jgi:hypothetical protein